MGRQSPAMHVVTSKRRHKGREYETTLVRRSYRDGDRVRKQTLANLSHLPPEAIDAVRRVLRGETLVAAGEALRVERSLGHGHVAAVLGLLRDLDLERLLSRERCRERELCVAMICQRLLDPCSKLSMTRLVHQTTLAEELSLGEVTEAELLSAMDWLCERQSRIEKALARRHLQGRGLCSMTCPPVTWRVVVVSWRRLATRATASPVSRRSAMGCAALRRVSRSRSRCTRATRATRRRWGRPWSVSRGPSGSSTWCLSATAG